MRPIPGLEPTVHPTGPELSSITDVADVGSRVLVVGLSHVPVGDPDDPQYDGRTLGSPIAWYTEDATTWTNLSSAFPRDAELVLIRATASQIFVVAYDGLLVWDATSR